MTFRKIHSDRFKLKVALEALKGNKTIAAMCHEFGVQSGQIYLWKKQLEEHGNEIFSNKKQTNQKNEIDRLHKVIGQLAAERDFLSRVLDR